MADPSKDGKGEDGLTFESSAFEALERCRADGVLENYAVTQSSLEDVFVRVCK